MWHTKCQAKEFELYSVRVFCKGGIKSASLEEWHIEYRVEGRFVFSPTKDSVSMQATWQRQSENNEKFNKATQQNAVQLLECMGSKICKGKHAETKSRGNDDSPPSSGEAQPLLPSLMHSGAVFPNTHDFHNLPVWQLSSPEDYKHSEGRARPITFMLSPNPQ